MSTRFLVGMTAPIMAISILPLVVGALTAWNVHQ